MNQIDLFESHATKPQDKSSLPLTAAQLITWIQARNLPQPQERDWVSAVNRICLMGGVSASQFVVTPVNARDLLAKIEPAAHGVSRKTFSNIRSNFTSVCVAVGVIDGNLRGVAKQHPEWAKLRKLIADDKSLSNGLARFMAFCAFKSIEPDEVNDAVLIDYLSWLEERTLVPKPLAHARCVPKRWNKALEQFDSWPNQKLSAVDIGRTKRKIAWVDLPCEFKQDADRYLEGRRNPDPFDEHPNAPTRPLADGTIRQHREHIRLAFHVLLAANCPPENLASLVEPESVKIVLRHYFGSNDRHEPNAFVVGLGKTLIAIAKTYLRLDEPELGKLKKLTGNLPPVPFDLTEKNKKLLRHFDDDRNIAALFGLVDELFENAKYRLDNHLSYFHNPAQAGLAIAVLMAAPIRSQNLVALNWRRHFQSMGSANGKKNDLRLIIPASETKTKQRDCIFYVDTWLQKRIDWYRRNVLPAINADPNGDLFALPSAKRRCQSGLCGLISQTIKRELGIHMTPHQFRHLAAKTYLDQRPEDFETVRQLLGHSFMKTTLIYSGMSNERASRTYAASLADQRMRMRGMTSLRAAKKPIGRVARTGDKQ
jgi:integrase